MKGGAVLFVLALLGAAAAWALLVFPAGGEAAGAAEEIEKADLSAAWDSIDAWKGPTPEEARRLEEGLAAFAPAKSETPLPAGIHPGGTGIYEGVIPAAEVQDLLAWVASRPESVTLVHVTAAGPEEGPGMAACRVVLAEGAGR